MNAFISLARARYSVRKFKDAPISEESLHRILVAGQLAPTACNGFNAPVILCVCAETDRTWKNPLEDGITSAEQDAAIVATHMMLAAWEEGIGSCWVGYFPPSKLAEVLGLAQNHKPVLLMPMGYPAEDAAPSPLHEKTRSLDELVTTL